MPVKTIADYNDSYFRKIQNNITQATFRGERSGEVVMAGC